MNRSIDVRSGMQRFVSNSKPVHAVAGAGVLASQTLRGLPARLVRWRGDTRLSVRAGGYLTSARARAAGGYDKLADRGKQVLSERASLPGRGTVNGKSK